MNVKFCVVLILLYFNAYSSFAQRYNSNLLDTLGQISETKAPSNHFAKLYYKAIEITNAYAHTQPQRVKDFIFGFENSFGPLFFKAHQSYIKNDTIPVVWQTYYKYDSLNELQYQFLGMNAHINGDMWKALANKYSADTLKYYKKELLHFQAAFNVFFDSIYTTTKKYKKVKRLHFFTLGLDKIIGRRMVYRWRKNAVNLAIWYYENPNKFKRKLNLLNDKIKRYNRFALQNLN